MPTSGITSRCLRFLVCAFGASVLAGTAGAGSTLVYKCFDRNLNVLYTDQPCKGEQLEIRAGDPDAAAVAALQKERDALARSIDQRIADSRKPREVVVRDPYVLPPASGAYAANEVWYPGYFAYPPQQPQRRGRDDAAPDERRARVGYVPNPLPPRNAPRR